MLCAGMKKGGKWFTNTMLSLDVFYLENSVDPDQLASEKPADQDLHCFPLGSFVNELITIELME